MSNSASERVSINDDVIDSSDVIESSEIIDSSTDFDLLNLGFRSKDFGLLNLGFCERRASLTSSNTCRSSIFNPKNVQIKDTKEEELEPILLPESNSQSGENLKKNHFELSAFSGSSVGNWSHCELNATVIEQIFNRRSDNLIEMFPNVCPMPIALMYSLDAKNRNDDLPQIISNNLMNPDSSQDTLNQNNDTFQSPPSTPEKSVSKNFMNVLYNRKHRLLNINLPMRSKDETIESTNSTPVAP